MARKVYRCVKCGSWSELGPPDCRHRGEHELIHVASANPWGQPSGRTQRSSRIVASGRGPSAGREGKYLLISAEEPSRGRWITERMDAYEHAQKRGAVKGALRDAYNSRARLGPITVRYTSAGVVYD